MNSVAGRYAREKRYDDFLEKELGQRYAAICRRYFKLSLLSHLCLYLHMVSHICGPSSPRMIRRSLTHEPLSCSFVAYVAASVLAL